jgi:hypothetical protein
MSLDAPSILSLGRNLFQPGRSVVADGYLRWRLKGANSWQPDVSGDLSSFSKKNSMV